MYEEDDEEQDDLEEFIAERAKINPDFPAMVEAKLRERQLLRALAARRVELGISRRKMAKLLEITPTALEGLERGETDPKLSTLMRFASAVKMQIEWRLNEAKTEAQAPV